MAVCAPDLTATDLGLNPRQAALVADEVTDVCLLGLDVVELEHHQIGDPAIDALGLQQDVPDVGPVATAGPQTRVLALDLIRPKTPRAESLSRSTPVAVRAHNLASFNFLEKRDERESARSKRAHLSSLRTEVIKLEYRSVRLAAIHAEMRC